VVIDTGVIVSALLNKAGVSRQAFTVAVSKNTPLLALDTLAELETTLAKSKFEKFFSWQERISIIEFLTRQGEFVEIVSDLSVCRDPSDNKFLNLAIDGELLYIT
jgi:putative PIN family toxin of toxin-antitoxin system